MAYHRYMQPVAISAKMVLKKSAPRRVTFLLFHIGNCDYKTIHDLSSLIPSNSLLLFTKCYSIPILKQVNVDTKHLRVVQRLEISHSYLLSPYEIFSCDPAFTLVSTFAKPTRLGEGAMRHVHFGICV